MDGLIARTGIKAGNVRNPRAYYDVDFTRVRILPSYMYRRTDVVSFQRSGLTSLPTTN